MMILRITLSVYYNLWLKRLDTHLNEPTNKNSIKVPKVVKPTNKKSSLEDFGDLFNKQPNVPSLPEYYSTNYLLIMTPNTNYKFVWKIPFHAK